MKQQKTSKKYAKTTPTEVYFENIHTNNFQPPRNKIWILASNANILIYAPLDMSERLMQEFPSSNYGPQTGFLEAEFSPSPVKKTETNDRGDPVR
jgi:hypothetical protein